MAITNFIWDELSDNVLMETDKSGTPTVVYTNEPERFGELISQERSGVTSYYHYDGEHSTRLLTDENQVVTDTYIYSAYGELVARTGTTTNPFGYKGAVGYYTNAATDDIYVRARSYQPVTGRWLSRDPLGFVDGPNLYRAYFVPQAIDSSGSAASFPNQDSDDDWTTSMPGYTPGAFKVRTSDCDPYVATVNKGCCCTDFLVMYYPDAAEQAKYTRIKLVVESKKTVDRGWCHYSDDHDWAPDLPKDSQTEWVNVPTKKQHESNRHADWTDFPGGGASKGLQPFCPGYCRPAWIYQEWNVCAIGIQPNGAKVNIGCVNYAHHCSFFYNWVNILTYERCATVMCDVDCFIVRGGQTNGWFGKPFGPSNVI